MGREASAGMGWKGSGLHGITFPFQSGGGRGGTQRRAEGEGSGEVEVEEGGRGPCPTAMAVEEVNAGSTRSSEARAYPTHRGPSEERRSKGLSWKDAEDTEPPRVRLMAVTACTGDGWCDGGGGKGEEGKIAAA